MTQASRALKTRVISLFIRLKPLPCHYGKTVWPAVNSLPMDVLGGGCIREEWTTYVGRFTVVRGCFVQTLGLRNSWFLATTLYSSIPAQGGPTERLSYLQRHIGSWRP